MHVPPTKKQEALSERLSHLPPLASLLPTARPSHFPPPLAHPGRPCAARALQAHALALADARAGVKWWLPLRAANRAAAAAGGEGGWGGGWEGEDDAAWAGQDAAWRWAWQRALREEAARPSGLPPGAAAGPRQRVVIERDDAPGADT
jgi:hypothetical protein